MVPHRILPTNHSLAYVRSRAGTSLSPGYFPALFFAAWKEISKFLARAPACKEMSGTTVKFSDFQAKLFPNQLIETLNHIPCRWLVTAKHPSLHPLPWLIIPPGWQGFCSLELFLWLWKGGWALPVLWHHFFPTASLHLLTHSLQACCVWPTHYFPTWPLCIWCCLAIFEGTSIPRAAVRDTQAISYVY